MSGVLRVTILGCGSSGGVPRLGGDWGACDPAEPRNRRTRCAVLIQRWAGQPAGPKTATTILIDTPPELRLQLAETGVRHLDAILYSHDHADQSHGIDDLRAFAMLMRRPAPVYMDAPTRASLTDRFAYCFKGAGTYPPVLREAGALTAGEPFRIDGPGGPVNVLPLAQDHGDISSLGFRLGLFGYNNDVVRLPEQTFSALDGLALWVVDALRYRAHPTHANVATALDWTRRGAPARAVLTNLHVDLDYRTLAMALPQAVQPAYDGLAFDLPYRDFP